MSGGVNDIPRIRAAAEAQGFEGCSEVKIFSAAKGRERDAGEVLDSCIERHRQYV